MGINLLSPSSPPGSISTVSRSIQSQVRGAGGESQRGRERQVRGAGGEREGGREGRLASPFWREGRQGLWGVEEELEGRQGLGGGEAELDAGSWVCATQSPGTVSMRRHGVNLSPAKVRVRGDVATQLRPQAHNSCEHADTEVFLLPVSNLEMLFAS